MWAQVASVKVFASVPAKGLVQKIAAKYSADDMEGTLSLELEEAEIFITVEGWDISDKEILYEYLLAIDFELVLEVLG